MKSTTDLNMVNAYIPGRADVGPATAAMIARLDALLGPAYRLMYERPLHIVRGEGAWLIDPDGRRYLDAYNNVTSLGHCHPSVTEAICRQVQTLATNTRYLHDTILELAAKHRIPTMYAYRDLVQFGGLMSYGVDLEEIGRSTGYQMGQILNGTNPGDIPFNQATHYELAINLKTAKSLGIEFPATLLGSADLVVE